MQSESQIEYEDRVVDPEDPTAEEPFIPISEKNLRPLVVFGRYGSDYHRAGGLSSMPSVMPGEYYG